MNPRFPNRLVAALAAVLLLFGIVSAGLHAHDTSDADHQRGLCAACAVYAGFSHSILLDAVSVPVPPAVVAARTAFLERVFLLSNGQFSRIFARGPPKSSS